MSDLAQQIVQLKANCYDLHMANNETKKQYNDIIVEIARRLGVDVSRETFNVEDIYDAINELRNIFVDVDAEIVD